MRKLTIEPPAGDELFEMCWWQFDTSKEIPQSQIERDADGRILFIRDYEPLSEWPWGI